MNTTFEQLLLQIARLAIKEKLVEEVLIDKSDLLKSNPQLDEPGAVFVTLKKTAICVDVLAAFSPIALFSTILLKMPCRLLFTILVLIL